MTISRRALLHRIAAGGAGLWLAPLLAACAVQTNRQRYAVNISGPHVVWFDPGSVTIPRGATVVWKNNDSRPHTVTCDPQLAEEQGAFASLPQDAGAWDSGPIEAGATWSHVFTTPGRYVYFSQRELYGPILGSIFVE